MNVYHIEENALSADSLDFILVGSTRAALDSIVLGVWLAHDDSSSFQNGCG